MSVYIQFVISIPIFFLGLVAIVLIDKYNFNSKSDSKFKNGLLLFKVILLWIVVPLSMILLINSTITLAKKYGIIFESVMDYNDTVLMLLSTIIAYAIAYVQYYYEKQKSQKEKDEETNRENMEKRKHISEMRAQQVRALNVLSGQKGYVENINIKKKILGYDKINFRYNIEIGDFSNADACFYQPYFKIKQQSLICTYYFGKKYRRKTIPQNQYTLSPNTLSIKLNSFDRFFLFPAKINKYRECAIPKIKICLRCLVEDMSVHGACSDDKQLNYEMSFYIVPDSGYTLDGRFYIKLYKMQLSQLQLANE